MFGKLQGTVEYIGQGFVILMAGGVGFKIMLADNTLLLQKVGGNASFWTETILRQDAISLVGFDTLAGQDLFVKLTGVSGIGTKLALAIIGSFKPSVLESAIAGGDVLTLTSVPGVGKKVAERIIVDLKGKVSAALGDPAVADGDVYGDTLSALEALGYKRVDCVELVQKLYSENPTDDVQSLITKALKAVSNAR